MKRICPGHYTLFLSATCLAIFYPQALFAQSNPAGFTTVIEAPPTIFFQSLDPNAPVAESNQFDSDTQVNVRDGGDLSDGVTVGNFFGTSTNVEVNIFGGRGGRGFEAFSGSTVNMLGGSVERMTAFSGSDVNILGGVVGSSFLAAEGSNVEISGGIIGDFFVARSESNVRYSGGFIDPQTAAHSGSDFEILGGDFRLNGVATNNSIVTVNRGDVLTGILQDGSVFVLAPDFTNGGDQSFFRLTQRAIPAFDANARIVVDAPTDFVPASLRQGQTLVLQDGGRLPYGFNSVGGRLEIEGGSGASGFSDAQVFGSRIVLVDSELDVSSGFAADVIIYEGSTANVSEGQIPVFRAYADTNTDITGGEISNTLFANTGSVVNVFDGEINRLDVGGEVNIFDADFMFGTVVRDGGELSVFGGEDAPSSIVVQEGGTLNISGGVIPSRLSTADDSSLNLAGSTFLIDGVEIPDLVLGEAFTVVDRNVIMSGVLADGTAFSQNLNSMFLSNPGDIGRIREGTRLTVTLTEAPPLLGDVNKDGAVNFLDISPFISVLAAGGFQAEADTNEDGEVSFLDISSFILLLSS